MSFAYSVERILEIVGSAAERIGDYKGEIIGIASLSEAVEGDLSFLGNTKYTAEVASSNASVLLLPKNYAVAPKEGQLYIKLDNPSYALALLCRDIEKALQSGVAPGIHPTASVEDEAVVSSTASIGAFCHIDKGAVIGDSVVLGAHVSIGRYAEVGDETHVFAQVSIGDYCKVGARNRLYHGCVIGSDGYGYEFQEGAHQRVPQIGNVVTEQDVDIGANSTIDRARFGSTLIGRGTKIDNQVQVGHNVQIGRNCLIVAQVGIGGSSILGDGVILAGQSGVAGHLKIGAGAIAGGGAEVSRSLKPKEKVRGPHGDSFVLYGRIGVLQRRLPELFKRFSELEKNVEALAESRVNQ
ncbi:MAG: UDP-3-O-[3-hydroxymyristoyl] glucosamine N-acyltransferase [Lentimonas sp.]|jgi:UDP-3-O-[3-hydroxymyristoyl] glucosamine N-acyltransferase